MLKLILQIKDWGGQTNILKEKQEKNRKSTRRSKTKYHNHISGSNGLIVCLAPVNKACTPSTEWSPDELVCTVPKTEQCRYAATDIATKKKKRTGMAQQTYLKKNKKRRKSRTRPRTRYRNHVSGSGADSGLAPVNMAWTPSTKWSPDEPVCTVPKTNLSKQWYRSQCSLQ